MSMNPGCRSGIREQAQEVEVARHEIAVDAEGAAQPEEAAHTDAPVVDLRLHRAIPHESRRDGAELGAGVRVEEREVGQLEN
jgi:hypothetical protein